MANNTNMMKVWDPLLRLFHWSLVLFFFVAYLGDVDRLVLHSYSGYAIGFAVAVSTSLGGLSAVNMLDSRVS